MSCRVGRLLRPLGLLSGSIGVRDLKLHPQAFGHGDRQLPTDGDGLVALPASERHVATVNEPADAVGLSLLLADEPTGNLDEGTAEALHALLREMHQERRLTSVIATHNMHLAASCDRVLRLEGGRLVADTSANG